MTLHVALTNQGTSSPWFVWCGFGLRSSRLRRRTSTCSPTATFTFRRRQVFYYANSTWPCTSPWTTTVRRRRWFLTTWNCGSSYCRQDGGHDPRACTVPRPGKGRRHAWPVPPTSSSESPRSEPPMCITGSATNQRSIGWLCIQWYALWTKPVANNCCQFFFPF